MAKIYTRGGDQGKTGLADGTRTRKSDIRIEALGAIDEINAHLGLLTTQIKDERLTRIVAKIQHELFDLGAALAKARTNQPHQVLPPGGTTTSAQAHISRTICRRAERRVFQLAETEPVPEEIPRYLNRLSDFLFVLARALTRIDGHGGNETLWQSQDQHRGQ